MCEKFLRLFSHFARLNTLFHFRFSDFNDCNATGKNHCTAHPQAKSEVHFKRSFSNGKITILQDFFPSFIRVARTVLPERTTFFRSFSFDPGVVWFARTPRWRVWEKRRGGEKVKRLSNYIKILMKYVEKANAWSGPKSKCRTMDAKSKCI